MVIPWEFQHSKVVADTDKKKMRKTSLLKENNNPKKTIRKQFYKKMIELVDVGMPNLWENFKEGALRSCYEGCGRKRCRRYMVKWIGEGGNIKKEVRMHGDVWK